MRSTGGVAESTWEIAPVRANIWSKVSETWRYRKILLFFAARNLKRMYQGTVLGKFWLFRPIIPVLIGSLIFGTLLGVPSDGVPYFMFFLTGMAVWMLFEQSCMWGTRSLDMNKGLVKKVYFPRLVIPASGMAPATLYFTIFAILILIATGYYLVKDGVMYLNLGVGLFWGLFVALMSVTFAMSISFFTSVWCVRARDVRFTMRYILRFWSYLTPVMYPLSVVPEEYRGWMLLNPMAGYVETFKWGVLGIGELNWTFLGSSLGTTAIMFSLGLWYYVRQEALAVDKM